MWKYLEVTSLFDMTPPNLSLLAADIARRIPEMAKDSTVNNEAVILNLLKSYMPKPGRSHPFDCPCGFQGTSSNIRAHRFQCEVWMRKSEHLTSPCNRGIRLPS